MPTFEQSEPQSEARASEPDESQGGLGKRKEVEPTLAELADERLIDKLSDVHYGIQDDVESGKKTKDEAYDLTEQLDRLATDLLGFPISTHKEDFYGKELRRDQIKFLKELAIIMVKDQLERSDPDRDRETLYNALFEEERRELLAEKEKQTARMVSEQSADGLIIDFKCSYKELTQLPALPRTLKKLDCQNNQLSQLPELPRSLQLLWCLDNHLTELPKLPQSLRTMCCLRNQLAYLPELPRRLEELYCQDNQLSELPDLPISLKVLLCNNNSLIQLPLLSPRLNRLECKLNKLAELPEFPRSLQHLSFESNQITKLPELPPFLITLGCSHNKLTQLPKLPALKMLDCYDNPLTPEAIQKIRSHPNYDPSNFKYQ